MASSAEAVQLPEDSAECGNVGGVGNDERPSGLSDAEVLVVGETRRGDPIPAVLNGGFVNGSQLACILYKGFGWLRHSIKQKNRCPSCKATVTCKGRSPRQFYFENTKHTAV